MERERRRLRRKREEEGVEALVEVTQAEVRVAVKNVEEKEVKKRNLRNSKRRTGKRSTEGLEVDDHCYLLYLICYKIRIRIRVQLSRHNDHLETCSLLFSIIVLMALRLFLRNLGSTPWREAYLCLLGLWIPFLCAFLPWLWLVWFLLFAMIFNNA